MKAKHREVFLYETKLFRMNHSNSHEIERYAKLTDTAINIYKNEMTAKVTPKRTIMKIPLMYIQHIQLVNDYSKQVSVLGQNRGF